MSKVVIPSKSPVFDEIIQDYFIVKKSQVRMMLLRIGLCISEWEFLALFKTTCKNKENNNNGKNKNKKIFLWAIA